MQTHTWNSPKFIKYAKLWAASIGEPEPESEDAFELWGNKLTELPSYIRKLEPVKPMRWFSVNQCIYETRCEFWPSKMIYKSYFPENGHEGAEDELDPALQISGDPKAELRQLRSTESGFPLAARLMCQWTMSRANIYYHGIIFVFVLFFSNGPEIPMRPRVPMRPRRLRDPTHGVPMVPSLGSHGTSHRSTWKI